MLGDAVFYAANRATHSAVESVARRATWMVIAAVLLSCALVLSLVVAFWYAEPLVGAINAGALIAGVCLVVGLICLSMPWLIEHIEQIGKRQKSPMATTVAVVKDEAKEAVDYFGALQVVGAAFLFGMGAARRMKGNRRAV
jgi:FtsH-binding integral membrane protein